ncbi:MAG: Dam family site-specific DNA-(adenine-N6)-methyltransferase [Paracholeplasma sp.]|nr:Dam family site-specific DNA-(adenine-N6)-methyltransferase [Paracholeplasma sp.]MDY3195489.1 Dam family site-specific DNA-(adenine-N6)-methyltransferase [Paracholeplasma sp.]
MVKPVLKWAGGKNSIINKITERIEKIPDKTGTFYDVFVGGGSVAIAMTNYFKNITINDINKELIIVYEIVKSDPEGLIELLMEHEKNHSKEYYYSIREMDRKSNYKELSMLVRAARTIYLNKTGYNGLFRVNRNGYYNVPIGRQKTINIYNKDNIMGLSAAFKNIKTLSNDFFDLLDICKPNDVVYLDPPYDKIKKDSFVSYNSSSFDDLQQSKVVELIDRLTAKGVYVIASNSYTEHTKKLYHKYIKDGDLIDVKRTISAKAADRTPVKEILIDNIEKVNINVNKGDEVKE